MYTCLMMPNNVQYILFSSLVMVLSFQVSLIDISGYEVLVIILFVSCVL